MRLECVEGICGEIDGTVVITMTGGAVIVIKDPNLTVEVIDHHRVEVNYKE